MPNLKINDVFSREIMYKHTLEYWKVKGFYSDSYDVIKCNKNGMEFKDRNSFSFNIDSSMKRSFVYSYIGNFPSDEKAYTDEGLVAGAKKRRISYLKDVIATAQEELDTLIYE